MPEIFQAGTREPSRLSTGELDFHPGGWSKQDWVVAGGDLTGVTCIPNQPHTSPPYVDTQHSFVRGVQVTPDEDISEDLARNLASITQDAGGAFGPSYFSVGVITGAWFVARSVDGDVITAQWYVAGEAVGSQITFDNEEHKTVRLPNFFYGIESWIRRESLTLRIWGGEFRTSGITLLPRPTQSYNAIDIIDPAATIHSVISDSLSTSGGDVVLAASGGSISISSAEELLLITATADIAEQSLDLLYVNRAHGPPLTTNTARYKNFSPYITGDSFSTTLHMSHEIWVNDVWISNEPEWSGTSASGSREYTVWVPALHNMFNGMLGSQGSLVWDQTPILVAEDDEIEIRVYASDDTYAAYDEVHIGRRIDSMQLVYEEEPADVYPCAGGTFDLEWTYTGPTTQDESITVDRSSLFTDLDGLVYDTSGTIVNTDLGITSPWTVDLSSFAGATGTFYAIIRGTLADGSYAYTGWQFDVDCGAGQIYRRL